MVGRTPPAVRCRRDYRVSSRRICWIALVTMSCFPSVSVLHAQTPSAVGEWSNATAWPYKPVHAHLLPTGKVLFWPTEDSPKIWDPETNKFSTVPKAGANIFCSGHAFLSDGRLFVAGGHVQSYFGLPDAYTYSPSTNKWTRLPDMNAPRWYPTVTTLSNGDLFVISGQIDTTKGMNAEPQVWQVASASWRNLSTAHLILPYYPYISVAPNGDVFMAGPNKLARYLSVSGTGAWRSVASNNYGNRNWGSSVMYGNGKVLVMGGSPCGFYTTTCTTPPTRTAEIIDLTNLNPSWKYTGSMNYGRRLHNATLLPDGQVLVTGGTRGSEDPNTDSKSPAYASEMWDPATGTWSLMASFAVFRGYHSTALLLPDGRVFSGGGQTVAASVEIYSPPYLFKGARPKISSAPANIDYGKSFFVGTPDAASITKVSMIALSSVTHGFNMTQRISLPAFAQANDGLNVTAPSSGNAAPPGYYMLFILDSAGVPSVAKILQLGGGLPNPSPTPTATPTPTPTATPTPTPIPTATPTPTPTATPTPTPSATPAGTPTPTPTPTPAPAAPADLTAKETSSRQIHLSWKDKSNNEAGFRIERSTNGSAFTQVAAVGANITAYDDDGLAAADYSYRVCAYNAGGMSAYSKSASVVLGRPAAPTNLAAHPIGKSGRVNLSWRDNSRNETGFQVERSRDGSGFAAITTTAANVTKYRDSPGTKRQRYYYRVCAKSKAGLSAYSNVAIAP
jgi:Domain of unknown function (DUF1929)/Kelch motif